MRNSAVFKKAHAMTREVIQKGDNYAATFAACLKIANRNTVDNKTIKDLRAIGAKSATIQAVVSAMPRASYRVEVYSFQCREWHTSPYLTQIFPSRAEAEDMADYEVHPNQSGTMVRIIAAY